MCDKKRKMTKVEKINATIAGLLCLGWLVLTAICAFSHDMGGACFAIG
jgi:hypothetical protein